MTSAEVVAAEKVALCRAGGVLGVGLADDGGRKVGVCDQVMRSISHFEVRLHAAWTTAGSGRHQDRDD